MPPKGWRKNGESSQVLKDAELVSIDDILFPRSTIQKLAKSILVSESGDNMSLAKDSLTAVQRSATVFVSHLAFHARQVAREADRKNLNSQDILVALERANLAGFSSEVKRSLSTYEATVEEKKKEKAEAKLTSDGEPSAKKLKATDSNAVETAHLGEEEPEDDIDDAEDDLHESDAHADEALAEADTPEVRQSNPIALLNQEENELEGTTAPEPREGNASEEEEDVKQLT